LDENIFVYIHLYVHVMGVSWSDACIWLYVYCL